MELHLDMYQTLAIAVLVLLLGRFLKKKIIFMENSVFRRRRWWFAFCNPDLRTIWNRNRRSFL